MSGPGRLRDLSVQSLSHSSNGVSDIKVVVSRAGRLREWSQEGLRRYQGPQNRRIEGSLEITGGLTVSRKKNACVIKRSTEAPSDFIL